MAVELYPNPFSSKTTISVSSLSTTNYELITLKIYDVLGRAVFHSKLRTPNTELDLKELPAGIYFYQVTSPENSGQPVARGKLVKQ